MTTNQNENNNNQSVISPVKLPDAWYAYDSNNCCDVYWSVKMSDNLNK